MGGRIRNFTQETYDEFSRSIRTNFEENNVLLEEINSAFITTVISEDINLIKTHNNESISQCNRAQFYLDKVFTDVYEVEGKYATKFDDIVQKINYRTKALKALTESLGQIADSTISVNDFRIACREHIAESLGIKYWEYIAFKPLAQLTKEEYKWIAKKVEEIMQRPTDEITELEYRIIAERLVKIVEAGDTNEMETILSWCYENEQFMGEQAFADDNPIPYLQTLIMVNQNGKMSKILNQLNNMLDDTYYYADYNGKEPAGETDNQSLIYEKNVLQMSNILKGLLNIPQNNALMGNSLYLSCSETETGERVFEREQLFQIVYLKDDESLHGVVDRYLDNGNEINDKDLAILFNNQIRYSDNLGVHHNQYMIVEYPKNGEESKEQVELLAFNKLAECLIDTPEEIINYTINSKVRDKAINGGLNLLNLSKKANIVVSLGVDAAIVGNKIRKIPEKEKLLAEQKDIILEAEIISQLNLTSSRVVYSMDGCNKTNESFTLHGNSTTPHNLETLKSIFIEYGINEGEANKLSVQGILDNPDEYFRIRKITEKNGLSDIVEIRKAREAEEKAKEEAAKAKEETAKVEEETAKLKEKDIEQIEGYKTLLEEGTITQEQYEEYTKAFN